MKPNKTFIIYELVPEETKFFVADGHRSELDGCFINTKSQEEFSLKVREEVSAGSENEHWIPVTLPFVMDGTAASFVAVHCGFML